MSIAEIETILTTRAAEDFRLVLLVHPEGGFQCRVLGEGDKLLRLGTGESSTTILEAAQAADAAISAILDARAEAIAIRVVDDYLAPGKLQAVDVETEEFGAGAAATERRWIAQTAAGTWTDPEPTPRAAVQAAVLEDQGGGSSVGRR